MSATDELEHARERLNLQGEFLGVTSMACYSAPWFLQGVLLVLIGYMFFHKVRTSSKKMRGLFQQMEMEVHEDEEEEHILHEFNRLFFGFTVAKRNLASYWAGFSIYAITCVYALINTVTQTKPWWG